MAIAMVTCKGCVNSGIGFAAAVCAATLLLPAGMASAQSILDDRAVFGSGRYQMQPVNGGLARLDTRTGAIVLCRTQDGRIACDGEKRDPARDRADGEAPRASGAAEQGPRDDRRALQSLADRIAELEGRIAALESERLTRDDEAAADAAIDRARKLFRGFAGIMRDFDRELRGDGAGKDAPTDRGDEHGNDPLPDRT